MRFATRSYARAALGPLLVVSAARVSGEITHTTANAPISFNQTTIDVDLDGTTDVIFVGGPLLLEFQGIGEAAVSDLLPLDAPIGPPRIMSCCTTLWSTFDGGWLQEIGSGIFGFRLSGERYGWMRVDHQVDEAYVVVDYAYEDDPGASILAGQTIAQCPPLIYRHPLSGQVLLDATLELHVYAVGSNITYQWKYGDDILQDGGRISGTTTRTLAISAAQYSDAGAYSVDVGSDCGAINSAPAIITVPTPPSIVAWGAGACGETGNHDYGQTCVPPSNSGFTAIAAGNQHSLGLKADGSIAAWGDNAYGELNVPPPNAGFVAIAAGNGHSLALKSDGSIVAWGDNSSGQLDVPPPNSDFIAISAGNGHSLGLRADGSIAAWGFDYGSVPTPNGEFAAVAAGWSHSVGLKSDGSVVMWGRSASGPPSPNSGFVAIAAGSEHSLGLKADGSIVAWGNNDQGQLDVPAPNGGFVAVAAGGALGCGGLCGSYGYSLGLRTNGSVAAWGADWLGLLDVPLPNTGFLTIAAGGAHNLGIRVTPGDVDHDGDVDIEDLAELLSSFGSCAGDPGFSTPTDLNGDGCTDLGDLALLLSNFGR